MDEDNPLNRIRKAARMKIDELHEAEIIQQITSAIGDRRIKDLVDIVAREEVAKGWNTVVEFLLKSEGSKYPIPIGYDINEIRVEPLKYREAIFELFGCMGWEPVDGSTKELLRETYNADSSINASRIFSKEVTLLVQNHIDLKDTLFFNTTDFNHNISNSMAKVMAELQVREIDNLRILKQGETVSVLPLWGSEYGRRALSDIGVKGNEITTSVYDMVLSVLHVSSSLKAKLKPVEDEFTEENYTPTSPSNHLYKQLHQSIISHDTDGLVSLGSRQSFPVLDYLMRQILDQYRINTDSDTYRAVLASIRDHVAIRTPESIPLLSECALKSEPRLITPAILALGNFYDESTVNTLVNITCSKKSSAIRESCISAIDNLRQRCPETQSVVKKAISLDCRYATELKRYYKENWEK